MITEERIAKKGNPVQTMPVQLTQNVETLKSAMNVSCFSLYFCYKNSPFILLWRHI